MKKIVVFFPDQLARYKGMGKFLYDNYEDARELIDKSNDILGVQLSKYMFYEDNNDKLEFTCPAVFVISVTLYSIFRNTYNVFPDFFAGYGIGELSALTCAEVIKYEDAVQLAFNIGKLFSDYGYYTLDESIKKKHKEKMFKELEKMVKSVSINSYKNTSKVIGNVDGKEYNADFMIDKFIQNILEKKQWEKVMDTVQMAEIDNIIDIGPARWIGEISKKFIKKEKISYLDYLGDGYYSLAVFQTKKLFNRTFLLGKMMAVAVSVENKNFNDEEYHYGVIIPYGKIKEIYERYKMSLDIPTNQEIAQASNYLIQIMRTKGVTQDEIVERIGRLESETLISLT